MNRIGEYKTQSVLAAMQALVIVYGILSTAAILKASGYPDGVNEWRPFSVFVRQYGLVFMIVPALWVWTTIQLEIRAANFSRAGSLVSGVLVLIILLYVFLGSASQVTKGRPHTENYNYILE